MKFWNKNYNELTVKELSILAVVMGLIAGAITYFCYATAWVETVGEKITEIWNKIFHK